jgi:hydroxymethylpyrimidine pyrophosphatase-like HAD family hydrolase
MADTYAEPTLEHTVAFGDGANDVCMLRSAAAGVAMAASHASAVGAATVQLTESLGGYLGRFPHGLSLRTPSRCVHQA